LFSTNYNKTNGAIHTAGRVRQLENDRFMIYDRCPMTDVAMAISTDADTDADVAIYRLLRVLK